METTRADPAFVGRRIRLQVHNGHGSAMDQEGHLIEAGAVHASVKGRRREEERAAQGYDSTREASEATAAAGARVFSCAPRRGTPGARRGRPCAPAWAVNEVGLHEVGFAGGRERAGAGGAGWARRVGRAQRGPPGAAAGGEEAWWGVAAPDPIETLAHGAPGDPDAHASG